MPLSHEDQQLVIALLWSLKPSDRSIVEAALQQPGECAVATTSNSANALFYVELINLGLAHEVWMGTPLPISTIVTYALNDDAKADIASLLQTALTTGSPPVQARIEPEVVQILRRYADECNAPSQTKLALLYDHGAGVEQNYAEALKWYTLAAEQDDTTATNNLGVMHFAGFGVPRDLDAAMSWFRKAAELGSAGAMDNIGEMYARGLGVPQDNAQALHWFLRAADLGHPAARHKAETLSATT